MDENVHKDLNLYIINFYWNSVPNEHLFGLHKKSSSQGIELMIYRFMATVISTENGAYWARV